MIERVLEKRKCWSDQVREDGRKGDGWRVWVGWGGGSGGVIRHCLGKPVASLGRLEERSTSIRPNFTVQRSGVEIR